MWVVSGYARSLTCFSIVVVASTRSHSCLLQMDSLRQEGATTAVDPLFKRTGTPHYKYQYKDAEIPPYSEKKTDMYTFYISFSSLPLQ